MAGGKDVLETNSIDACLRSDLVTYIDEQVGHDSASDPHLLLQKELLTVTEVNPGNRDEPGDGFQVRDIACLDPGMRYLPPISIPFLDLELTERRSRYEALDDRGWVEFWEKAYAANLGRAKALFLLRYALQMGSPNGQNFLIELTPALKPTGRIVMRDLGDAQLYREVAWALCGDRDSQPAPGADGWGDLGQMTYPTIAYECNELLQRKRYIMETGVVDPDQAYGKVAGLQMRWNMFSSLARGSQVSRNQGSTDQDVRAEGWQRVLHCNASWGRAHCRSFVTTFNACLGLDCGVDIDAYPDPERYLKLGDTDYAGAGDLYDEDLQWEEAQSGAMQGLLETPQVQEQVRKYHAAWLAACAGYADGGHPDAVQANGAPDEA